MPDQTFAYIDLETTGGSAQRDRIIEVGLILIKNGKEIDRYSQLVNPQQPVSEFIQNYTHISNEMLQDQPLFADIAETLKEKLQDCVFVAHNARFDYSFVKNEFLRLGIGFSSAVLCTVKLSRKLYPEFHKHNLDALIERHDLHCEERHRAMGDVLATWQFVQSAAKDLGQERIDLAITECIKRIAMPPHLPDDILDQIPQLPGVYRFYDENDQLLYLGKNKNLYQRIQSHFGTDNHSPKAQHLSQQCHRLEWTETAGELGAVLLEQQQQLKLGPVGINAKVNKPYVSYFSRANNQGYVSLHQVDQIDPLKFKQYFGLFASVRQGNKALTQIASRYDLCPGLLGLETYDKQCSQYAAGYCKGACCGAEDPLLYNLRQLQALSSLQLKPWPWQGPILVQEKNSFSGLQESHLINYWTHLHTWVENGCHDDISHIENELNDYLNQQIDWTDVFNLDNYRLFNKMLLDPKQKLRIIPL